LQTAILIGALVPISAGLSGVLLGPALIDATARDMASADSHFRYLSGLLLGIGLVAWSQVPRIERAGPVLRPLVALVVVGGLARLASLILVGTPNKIMMAAIIMELVVTPALAVWQRRIERRQDVLQPLPRA
jgi:hypothetical protein